MMKRMKKGIVPTVILIVILLLAFAYAGRIRYVNRQLRDAPVQEFQTGEMVEFEKDILINETMEGYSIRVDRAEILDYEDFLEKYDAEDEYVYVPDKVYDVEVTLKNTDADEGTGISLLEFYVQGPAIVCGLNADLLGVANPQLDGAYAIALRDNSELVLHLPFELHEAYFKETTWDRLEDVDMNLVATLYPVKKVIALDR